MVRNYVQSLIIFLSVAAVDPLFKTSDLYVMPHILGFTDPCTDHYPSDMNDAKL